MYFKDFKVTVDRDKLDPSLTDDFSNREYPVLALERNEDGYDVLLAGDNGDLLSLDSNWVKVVK